MDTSTNSGFQLAQSALIIAPYAMWKREIAPVLNSVHLGDRWELPDWEKAMTMKDARELQQFAVQRPVGHNKVAVIPKADSLSRETANTLLKILEEPPLYLTIILLSETENLLPTVRSRVTCYRTGQVDPKSEWRSVLNQFDFSDYEQVEQAAKLQYLTPLVHQTVNQSIVAEAFQTGPL